MIQQEGIKIKSISLTLTISQHHSNIIVYIDFFYVHVHTFFHKKSDKVRFLSDQYLMPISK